jgi:hypothetical protein
MRTILALMLLLPLFAYAAGSSGHATMRAYDFYSKWGININMNGMSPSDVLTGLATVRLNRVRTSGDYDESVFLDDAQLAAAGVKLHIMYQNYNAPQVAMSDWLTWLKNDIVIPYPGTVIEASGPNEVNLVPGTFCYNGTCGVQAANLAQADLFAGIHRDPAFTGIKVSNWPVGIPQDPNQYEQVGDITSACDMLELHDYYPADNWHQFYGGVTKTNDAAIDDYVGFGKHVCNRPTFVTTEDGWCSRPRGQSGCQGVANGMFTTDYVAARVGLLTMIDHAKRPGNQGIYYFSLCCGNWYSVLADPYTPKPLGTAIANMMTIFDDAGATAATFTPTLLSYTVSGMPALSGSALLQKSDGSFFVILENDSSIYDEPSNTRIRITSSQVTVTLPSAHSGKVWDPVNSASPISTFANKSSVTVKLNDTPLIIEID